MLATIGYILLGLLGLLVLLLFIPVVLTFEVSQSTAVTVRYLFFRFAVYPRPEEPEPEKQGAKEKKKAAHGGRASPDGRPALDRFTDLMNTVADVLDAAKRLLHRVRRGLLLYRLRVKVSVGTGDAAETAITYGRLCAGVYTVYSIAASLIRTRDSEIQIVPDYLSDKTTFSVSGKLRILPMVVLIGAVCAGGAFLWRTLGRKLRENKLEGGAL